VWEETGVPGENPRGRAGDDSTQYKIKTVLTHTSRNIVQFFTDFVSLSPGN